jgi:hypothetical protein
MSSTLFPLQLKISIDLPMACIVVGSNVIGLLILWSEIES